MNLIQSCSPTLNALLPPALVIFVPENILILLEVINSFIIKYSSFPFIDLIGPLNSCIATSSSDCSKPFGFIFGLNFNKYLLISYIYIYLLFKALIHNLIGDWGLGIGDWGLGIG
ncbi:MAG: hypothetical protein MJ252_17485, partial [archaeon]|nr:hypothetical protein [archaeon]